MSILKMKQQQHDILIWGGLGKKSESQVGFEPTTLRDLVGCSNHLSYWRLYGEQGPICGSQLTIITIIIMIIIIIIIIVINTTY